MALSVKLIPNHWYPIKFNLGAITLYPYILFSSSNPKLDLRLLKHEMVHIDQIRRFGFVEFYLSYLYFMLKGLIRYRSFIGSYLNNPYELEARKYEHGPFTDEEREELGLL